MARPSLSDANAAGLTLSSTNALTAVFLAQTKMATVIVTMKIMPSSPEEDLDSIAKAASGLIKDFGGTVGKTDFEPIAFGLKAIVLMFAMSESLGDTEEVEKKIAELSGVNSVQVTDVRRAVG